MDDKTLRNILEAGLLVAARTMSLAQLEALFQNDKEKPDRKQIRAALQALKEDYQGRGIELVEVASGYRLQSHESVADWVGNLFQEKPPRYSRALLETLVLIAYRQPITRAEIEDVRGVAVSSNIIKTLQERQWVKVLGHKEVPGRPALLGTTKEFLDYFNLKKLDELPELADIKDLDQFDELLAEEVGEVGEVAEQGDAANDEGTEENSSANQSGNLSENQSNDDNQQQSQQRTESDRIQKMSAMLDQDADANPSDSENDAGSEQGRGNKDGKDDKEELQESDEEVSDAERQLLRVISDFSDEHQQEVDARDQLEAEIVQAKDGVTDEAAEIVETDLSDLSQRVGDDTQPAGMPEPGDTLH